jgi:hypothetical protein
MIELPDWWLSLDPSVQAAAIAAGATLLAAAAGFWVIGTQAAHAVWQNRRNEALKLKVRIYEQATQTSGTAQDAVSELTAYLRHFDIQLRFHAAGAAVPPPPHRFPEYQRLQRSAATAIIRVMTMIEQWQIVEPKLRIFGRAIAMENDRYRKATMAGPDLLVYAMPVVGFEAKWQPLSGADLAAVTSRIHAELYHMHLLSAWVGDFEVEMQLLLLGELFPNSIERRDPPDPDQFCIRLDRVEELERRLDASDWGRKGVEAEAEAWARFAAKRAGETAAAG